MRVLIVEDEPDLAVSLVDGLRREGYTADSVHDGAAALRRIGEAAVDVLILDRDLPVLTGDAVCRTLRAQQHPVRILMLTAAGDLDARVSGLDLGADDYLAKPFAYVELLARLRALGRRAGAGGATVLESADLRLDTVRRIVERSGHPVQVTRKEYGLLEALLSARGGWLDVDDLLDDVWEQPDERSRSVVKATVHTLRRKLGAPDPIQSAPGRGYRIGPPS